MSSLVEANVLVVDDEPDLCDMLAFQFRLQGSEVRFAHCGEDAFRIVESTPVDAVVTDIRMSHGDGIELLERIRSRDIRKPAVVFITAYDTVMLPLDAYDRGAEGIFSKPFRLQDLVDRVNHLLVPEQQRWNALPDQMPSASLQRSFGSLAESIQGRELALGRGGFACALPEECLSTGDLVRFDFRFETGALRSLDGVGVAKWVTDSVGAMPSACGIEFEYLSEASRAGFLDWLRLSCCRSYIPRLKGMPEALPKL